MPAKHDVNIAEKLILTKWEGVATDNDFIDTLKEYQKNIQTQNRYEEFNEVFDCTGTTEIKLTTNGLKRISSIASKTDNVDLRLKWLL